MSIIQLKRRANQLLNKLYALAFSATHKVENKILFISFAGKQYSDSPRAISEKMHEMYPEHEIVWTLNGDTIEGYVPNYARIIRGTDKHGLRFIEERATSFCFVTNNENDSSVHKRKGQYFVQTWHGDRSFKKVLYDAGVNEKICDSDVTDVCLAGSDFGERTYRTAFKYCGNVLNVGMPRNDVLLGKDNEKVSEIKKRLGIKEKQRILLYAPTFRDNQTTKQKINIDLGRVMNLLCENGTEWICVVRAHKSSWGFDDQLLGNEKLYDATTYPDIADILLIADFLISDYSSCAGDFILKRKPVILAAFDAEEYEKQCRSLSVDLDKSGYYIARNQEQLEKYIKDLTENDYAMSCEKALRYFGSRETGESTTAICKMIHEFYLSNIVIKPNNIRE